MCIRYLLISLLTCRDVTYWCAVDGGVERRLAAKKRPAPPDHLDVNYWGVQRLADIGSPGCQSSLTATPNFVHSGWTTLAATAGVTVVAPAAAREPASSEKNSSTPPGAYMYNTRAG